MDWSKVHFNAFEDQDAVDDCVFETERLAEQCDSEEIAIELLKNIAYLRAVESVFFVPDIVLSWEEMALSYVESQQALFESVHYPQIEIICQRGYQTFQKLEEHVKNRLLPEDALFGMIHGFNMDISSFNKICRQYNQKLFQPYICQDIILNKHYKQWRGIEDEH